MNLAGLDLPAQYDDKWAVEVFRTRQAARELKLWIYECCASIPTEVKSFFLYLVWFPDSLY